MKNCFPLLFLILLSQTGLAQRSYEEAIRRADEVSNTDYRRAIDLYFAAEAFDPTKKEEVKRKVNEVFEKIEALRLEANLLEKQTREALEEVQKAKEETQTALDKAEKLIDAFYFHQGKFAIANKMSFLTPYFYYIDREGEEIRKLHRWDKAEQFDFLTHLAKVQKKEDDSIQHFFLDTLGNTYSLADAIEKSTPGTTALDLTNNSLRAIPDPTFQMKDLKVLILRSNSLDSLSNEIEAMKELYILDLSGNNIKYLPPEIGGLNNLASLYLVLC